ncbi:MAG TPA: hypothetical protein VMJ72_00625 [Candidatus Paceibacterota bacterium]|nr:hypothetical protein [Candidatus Paceibacterota bacterium]
MIILAEGTAEQAHAGKKSFAWVAVRGRDGAFLPLQYIAGQSGRLVWIPTDEEAEDGRQKDATEGAV